MDPNPNQNRSCVTPVLGAKRSLYPGRRRNGISRGGEHCAHPVTSVLEDQTVVLSHYCRQQFVVAL
jgi:hypothetical protein